MGAMNLADFSLLKEDSDSYTVGHPQGKSIRVVKRGMSTKAQELVSKLKRTQNFKDGGEAKGVSEEDEKIAAQGIDRPAPAPIPEEVEPVKDYVPPVMNADGTGVPAASGQESMPPPPVQVPGDGAPRAPEAPPPVQVSAPQASALPDNASSLQTEKAAVQAGAAAEGAEGAEAAKALKSYMGQSARIPSPEQTFKAHQQKDQALQTAVANGKIDPNRYFKNQSTASRVTGAIAMVLGGIGSGLTGQPNMAAKMLENAVERDIDAQKNDQSKNMNLWKMNRENTQSEINANLSTQNQMMGIVKTKMMLAAANAQSPMAAARIAPFISEIDNRITMNNWRKSMLDQQSMGGLTMADPAQLVPVLVQHPDQQKQVYEEIGRAQNVSRNSAKLLDAFDRAAKENTVLRTGAGLVRVPGSVMELHQLMLPNFKQVDGTVRQAAMDESYHNITPAPGDTAAKIAIKRRALADWMHSETAAPVAKGNGIDLSRFQSTAPPQDAQNVKTMGGVPYVKVPGGWKRAG